MGSKWILAILWLLVLLVRLVVFCALFLTDIYGFAQVPWCRKIRQWCPCWGWTTHIWKKNKYISIIIIYIYIHHLDWAGGRLWPLFLVACDRNFWSLVTAWTVTVSLFAAGAIFGHVGVSLLVASALFGDVGGSIFLAGAAFGEIWHSTGVVLCSME